MKASIAMGLTALMLAGCAGGLDEARRMDAAQIAAQPDVWVCDRLRTFAYKGRVPDAWIDAAVARGLEGCLEAGVERRRDDAKLERRRAITCRDTRTVQSPECW